MAQNKFVVCIRNFGYEASLEKRKLYEIVDDADAATHGQLRIIDESGDDYLFPQEYFASVELPDSVEQSVIEAA